MSDTCKGSSNSIHGGVALLQSKTILKTEQPREDGARDPNVELEAMQRTHRLLYEPEASTTAATPNEEQKVDLKAQLRDLKDAQIDEIVQHDRVRELLESAKQPFNLNTTDNTTVNSSKQSVKAHGTVHEPFWFLVLFILLETAVAAYNPWPTKGSNHLP